jgi:hypothetical protein
MMGLEVATTIAPDAWDEFASSNRRANIFHTRGFVECFDGCERYEPLTMFLIERGEPLAAIIAVQTKVLGSHLERMSSRSVVYGGVLCSDKIDERYVQHHIAALIRAYDEVMRKRCLYSEIRNVSEAADLIVQMNREGHCFVPHLNYIIDLTGGADRAFGRLSPTLRRQLRGAGAHGIDIEEVTEADGIEVLSALVELTHRRVHVPCFDRNVFQHAWRSLAPRGQIRVTLARRGSDVVSARAFLIHNGRVIDWFAGSTEPGYQSHAGPLLVWDAIQWGIKQNCSTFDFGGAGDPSKDYTVRDFKSRFHGRAVNHGRFVKVYSRARYGASRCAYALIRRVAF